ncbi:MAG: sialate O-acetylesterase [Planctomycetota bacterium]
MHLALVLVAGLAQTPTGPTPLAPVVETVLDRQVFQRDAKDGAEVRVEGSCLDGLAHATARVLRGAERVVTKELELRDLEGPRQRFSALVRVPAGGWYALELAESADAPAFLRVEHFGVGEVFVIAGQSNSTNFGEERTPSEDDRVSAFDGLAWSLARDPMPGVQDKSNLGSPWPRFGARLAKELGVPIGLASTGFGGTSIRAWQKDHVFVARDDRRLELFRGLAERLEQVGPSRAILWHQGETDALGSMSAKEYVELFTKLRADLAAELDLPLPPIVVAHASYVPDLAGEKMQAIRDAQAELWKAGLALEGPDTDVFRGELRHSHDHIHFSKAGLAAHADAWFARVKALFFAPKPERREDERPR